MPIPTNHRYRGPFFLDRTTGVRMHPAEFPLAAGLIAIPARRVAQLNRERAEARRAIR